MKICLSAIEAIIDNFGDVVCLLEHSSIQYVTCTDFFLLSWHYVNFVVRTNCTCHLTLGYIIIRYDTIDDLHWKTDRQAASLI